MSSADWTPLSNGSGVYAIIADGTAPSPPDVMNITAGGQMFQNITAGPFKNSRVTAWIKQGQSAGSTALLLCLRSLDNTTFSAAPATYFRTTIASFSTTEILARAEVVVNGVLTTIVSVVATSQNGNPVNSWQQFQFSAFNNGTDILLRVAQWTGAVFAPILDCAAPIATFPTLDAAGSCRFGGSAGSAVVIDDVNYYSLA